MIQGRFHIPICLILLALSPVGRASVIVSRMPSSAMMGSPDPGSMTGVTPDTEGSGPIEQVMAEASAAAQTKAAAVKNTVTNEWKRFRPAWSQNGIPGSAEAEALQSKTLIENIYSGDMKNRMDYEYMQVVAPYEKQATDITRPVRQDQMMRYMNAQREMVRWSMKQIGQGQLWDNVRNIQTYGSGGMLDFVRRFHVPSRTGSDYDTYRRAPVDDVDSLTVPQKLARERRLDEAALAHNEGPDDPEVPTQLKPRMNPLKQHAGLALQSGVVNGFVEGGTHPGDDVGVEVSRQFNKYDLYTRVRYDVNISQLTVNLSKKLTREIAVELASDHWTGNQRSEIGERDRESARLTYSLGF